MVDIKNVISSLLTGPAAPDREYVIPGRTYGEVYETAAGILDACGSAGMSPGVPLCLCTEDKVLVAAAVLASLAGGPLLVIPMPCPSGASVKRPKPWASGPVLPTEQCRSRWDAGVIPHAAGGESESSRAASMNPCLQLFTGARPANRKLDQDTVKRRFRGGVIQAAEARDQADDFSRHRAPYHIYGFLSRS